ncbi:2-dehydropantoate 2-reductase [Pyrenochaeta sp. DS3sAY3a]|nr:2-dehydropantoate 2-reductase [Pyrenochaeta sp. DS3sAY3a]
MSRILVFGTGSVGTMYAMLLSMGGADVTCICRRSNYEIAASKGFQIRSTVFGDRSFKPRVAKSVQEAVSEESALGPFDFVVVCIKANNAGISPTELIRMAIKESYTSIVIIQNGLGVERIYQEAFPKNPIISGVTYMPTSQLSPCVVSHTETQKLYLGIYSGSPNTSLLGMNVTEALAGMIRAAGADATVCADIQVERWKKLISNATWNPICALSRCRDLQFLQAIPDLAQEFVIESMREVVAVAAALGYSKVIKQDTIDAQVRRSALREWPGVRPSMLADIEVGGAMEVEAIVGEVVRVAKRNSVSVPRLETLYLLLRGYEFHMRSKSP